MQTNFTLAQLADHETARSEHILRKCVHCGFCTATCPTFVLLGDERDSPRGRIYLIKAMLEGDRAPTAQEVRHVDRCLSCLSCMTTCPSGVNYMHLVDHGRHSHRGKLQAVITRPVDAQRAGLSDATARPLPLGDDFGSACQATGANPAVDEPRCGGATFLRRLRRHAGGRAGPAGAAVTGGSAADFSGARAAAASGWR